MKLSIVTSYYNSEKYIIEQAEIHPVTNLRKLGMDSL